MCRFGHPHPITLMRAPTLASNSCKMKIHGISKRVLYLTVMILILPGEPAPGGSFNDSGPGTGGLSIPRPFTVEDFSSVRHQVQMVTRSISPPILRAIGACVDPQGGFPNDPVEYDLVVTTTDSLDIPWLPGETHWILLQARSSSSRFVHTPPRIELLLAGMGGGIWLDLGHPLSVSEDPIEWVVPPLPPGVYRFHAFDGSTGMCKTSDFTFEIAEGQQEEPTPTPTATETPIEATPTPTPTEPPSAVFDWALR